MAGAVIERYDRFWAGYLGITAAELNRPGLSIVPHVGRQGYRGIWCFRRRDRTVISAPPGWIPHLLSRLPEIRKEHLMDEFALREVFGGDFDQLVGPAYQGYLIPDLFRPYVGPQVRFVRQEDMVWVEAFQKECDPDAWEIAGFHEATANLAAICEGDRIVSLAGFNRIWRDEAGGPCILTHRAYRGRGLATATTSAVVERVLREGKLVLYHGNREGIPDANPVRADPIEVKPGAGRW